jgi:hypothetical protein
MICGLMIPGLMIPGLRRFPGNVTIAVCKNSLPPQYSY